MLYRALVSMNSVAATFAGLALALYPGFTGTLPLKPTFDIDPMLYYQALALTRVGGVAYFGLGVVSLVLLWLTDARARQLAMAALLIANFFGLVMTTAQQIAIWSSPIGAAIVSAYLFLTVGFGVGSLRILAAKG